LQPSNAEDDLFPVLVDFEGPFELEMLMIVVVHESRQSLICASCKHTSWSFFRRKLLLVCWLVSGVRWIATDHLLVFVDTDAFALDDLDELQTRENLMLDGKDGFHLICGAFLDAERFSLEPFECARLGEVDDNVRTSWDFLLAC